MIPVGYNYSKRSKRVMSRMHPQLQQLFNEALVTSPVDFGFNEDGGIRTDAKQQALFKAGLSKLDGVTKKSKHQPNAAGQSEAGDVLVFVKGQYTFEPEYYYILAGHIYATAFRLGLEVRWGGDWDMDGDIKDQSFNDLCHWEIILPDASGD